MVFKKTNITYITKTIVKQKPHIFSLFSISSIQRQRLAYKIEIWFCHVVNVNYLYSNKDEEKGNRKNQEKGLRKEEEKNN